MARRAHGAEGGGEMRRKGETVMSKLARDAARIACGLALLASASGVLAGAGGKNDPAARFRGTGKADPIRIENVSVKSAGVEGASTIAFDLAWDHSWRAAWEVSEAQHGGKGKLKLENWDAAWVFVKFRKSDDPGYSHASLSTPAGDHQVPKGAALDTGAADDPSTGLGAGGKRGLGVFVYRDAPGSGANKWKGVRLRWRHKADGVGDPDAVDLKVLAIHMVYVPKCAFWAGDGATNSPQPHFWGATVNSVAQFSAGRTMDPFRVEGEGAIKLGGESTKNLGSRESFEMARPEDFTGSKTRTLPAAFPKGYEAFYCMKYEITQGEYVAFLNTLDSARQKKMIGGNPNAKAGTKVLGAARTAIKIAAPGREYPLEEVSTRDGVSRLFRKDAAPATYETDSPYVPCCGLGMGENGAYLAWAGLRPMTELEYEKACRGPLKPVPNEYAWGTDQIAGTNTTEPPRDGYKLHNAGRPDENVTWVGENGPSETRGNAVWNGTVLQGRGSYPAHHIGGPLRVGIFATPESDRVRAGASYWGIMELSGNLMESTVAVGKLPGRRFKGTHGDGTLAQPADWPAWSIQNVIPRGGNYGGRSDLHAMLAVSNRSWGGQRPFWGGYAFRAVRTAPRGRR
jgi:hypothetical protein